MGRRHESMESTYRNRSLLAGQGSGDFLGELKSGEEVNHHQVEIGVVLLKAVRFCGVFADRSKIRGNVI